jgi:hypothetical protein
MQNDGKRYAGLMRSFKYLAIKDTRLESILISVSFYQRMRDLVMVY